MNGFKKRVVVVREPIAGSLGIHKLYGMVKAAFRIKAEESLYVVFFTKKRTRLKILHVDVTGVDLITRRLFRGLFLADYSVQAQSEISEEALQRLLFDGTMPNTPWQNPLAPIFLKQNGVIGKEN